MRDLSDLQAYTLGRSVTWSGSAKQLLRELRNVLRTASNARALVTKPQDVLTYVRQIEPRQNALRPQLQALGVAHEAIAIVGGDKNFGRSAELKHFRRRDGAWFDFSLTLRESTGTLELLAYDFEIRLPPGYGAPFVRFDLNLPEHRNEERELRSHAHFGSDDLLVPAPVMKPDELLKLFIYGLQKERNYGIQRMDRSPSDFERDWLAETCELMNGVRLPGGERS